MYPPIINGPLKFAFLLGVIVRLCVGVRSTAGAPEKPADGRHFRIGPKAVVNALSRLIPPFGGLFRTWRWRRIFEKFTARMVLPAVNDEFVDEMFSVGCQITLLMPRHDIPSSDRCPAV